MIISSPEQSISYDPNWYLSTVVQSTAALTAILGGFLISRVISLALRRNELADRKSYLQTRLDRFAQEREHINVLINKRVHKIFLDRHLEEIIWTIDHVDIEKILKSSNYFGKDAKELRIYAETVIQITKTASEQLEARFPTHPIPTDVEQLQENGLNLKKWDVKKIYSELALVKNKQKNQGQNQKAWSNSMKKPIALSGERTNRRHDERIRRREELDFQISQLFDEIQLVETQGNSKISSKMLNNGLIILTYFGGVGIGYPLFEMSRNPVHANGTQRDAVFILFSTGFILMGTFIFRAIRNLDNV